MKILSMKKAFIFFLLMLALIQHNEIFAGRKIQWQKYLNDTTISPLKPNWIVQSSTTDNENNLYISAISNGGDTSISVLTKFSKDGEQLWQHTVLPFSIDKRFRTNSDWTGKLYIDLDNNLVCINAGYDTLGSSMYGSFKRFILMTKWSKNGSSISSYLDYFPNYNVHGEDLKGIIIGSNGDIFISHAYDNYTNIDLSLKRYNKDFNNLFFYTQNVSLGNDHLVSPPVIAIKDSFLNLAYSTTTPNAMNHIYILQININTEDTIWQKTINTFDYYVNPIQLEIMNGALYLTSMHLIKLSLVDGTILAEDNFQYAPTNCFFDSSANRIYCLNIYSEKRTKKVTIYDADLNLINTINFPYWPRNIVKKDSILSVLCIDSSLTNEFYWNRVAVFRVDSNENIIDSLFYTYPKPIVSILGKTTFLNDTKNDLIVLSEIRREHFYDSLGHINSAAPIFIQKICYNCLDELKGKVFLDTIFNCKFDSTESIIENNFIHLMPEDIYTSTDSQGYFYFSKSSGIANIEYVQKFDNTFLCNSSNSYVVDLANGYNDTLNFGLRMKALQVDASCNLSAGSARPGFQHYTILNAENLSPSKQYNLHLELNIDNKFTFLSASQSADSILGSKLVWLIDSLNPGATKQFYVISELSSTTNINDNFQHTASIKLINDAISINNLDTIKGLVTGSFDPNYKLANPVGAGKQHYIEDSVQIDYYIEFQNTGTDTAFNIKIFDLLDNNLDLSTFKIIGASHKMTYRLENRYLKFYFNDIMLVDSNKNYDKSIGFVTYSIKPKNCHDGIVIKNTAEIYFDYNAPIITNSTFHTIGRIGSYFENISINDFNLFPNPIYKENLNVTVNLIVGNQYQLILTDITGKPVYTIKQENVGEGKFTHQINLTDKFAGGMYFVTLQTANNTVTKKIILTK